MHITLHTRTLFNKPRKAIAASLVRLHTDGISVNCEHKFKPEQKLFLSMKGFAHDVYEIPVEVISAKTFNATHSDNVHHHYTLTFLFEQLPISAHHLIKHVIHLLENQLKASFKAT